MRSVTLFSTKCAIGHLLMNILLTLLDCDGKDRPREERDKVHQCLKWAPERHVRAFVKGCYPFLRPLLKDY